MVNTEIKSVDCSKDKITIILESGRHITIPKLRNIRLATALNNELVNCRLINNGAAVRWDKLGFEVNV